ncbi:hypothetical protein E2C01_076136 [Portunus trituberculatus]|uniref:Uncharacterized protein n=1 Tax=Portunus trituberculatus TaxID=210409 RepID=A0A5B7IH19_PORTR|nr:hypothetical protein [Portunus trituberculatus]
MPPNRVRWQPRSVSPQNLVLCPHFLFEPRPSGLVSPLNPRVCVPVSFRACPVSSLSPTCVSSHFFHVPSELQTMSRVSSDPKLTFPSMHCSLYFMSIRSPLARLRTVPALSLSPPSQFPLKTRMGLRSSIPFDSICPP